MVYPKRSFGGLLLRGAGWIYVLLMVIGTISVVIAGSFSQRAMHLEDGGVDTVGVVTDLEITTRKCGTRNRGTCTDYWVSYEFKPEDGAVMSDRKSVAEAFYLCQIKGQALPVRYVADAPSENEIEPGDARFSSWIGLAIGGAMWLGVGVFGPRHVRATRRALYLRDHGQMRRATVTEVRHANIKVNRQPLFRIVWDAPPGQSWAAKRGLLPDVGAGITVFAHPEGLWPPAWEGDVGSR